MGNKFAIELISNAETIEQRLLSVLEFINKKAIDVKVKIYGLEATGTLGSKFSEIWDLERVITTSLEELIQMAKENGQIFELHAIIDTPTNNYTIFVVRGQDLDVLSDDFQLIEKNVLGPFRYVDLALFNEGIDVSE